MSSERKIMTENEGDTKELDGVLAKLKDYQIDAILKYAVSWNTNSKNCHVAQHVITIILRTYTVDDLLKLSNFKSSLEGLIPYTERHSQRMNRLQQQSTFIDYTWQSMRLVSGASFESDPLGSAPELDGILGIKTEQPETGSTKPKSMNPDSDAVSSDSESDLDDDLGNTFDLQGEGQNEVEMTENAEEKMDTSQGGDEGSEDDASSDDCEESEVGNNGDKPRGVVGDNSESEEEESDEDIELAKSKKNKKFQKAALKQSGNSSKRGKALKQSAKAKDNKTQQATTPSSDTKTKKRTNKKPSKTNDTSDNKESDMETSACVQSDKENNTATPKTQSYTALKQKNKAAKHRMEEQLQKDSLNVDKTKKNKFKRKGSDADDSSKKTVSQEITSVLPKKKKTTSQPAAPQKNKNFTPSRKIKKI